MTDQLAELIRLWNRLNDGQREGVLRLLRIIVEEGEEDDDEARA